MLLQRTGKCSVIRTACRRLRYNNNIQALEHRLMGPKGFFDLALDTIARNGLRRYAPRHSYANADADIVLACIHQEQRVTCLEGATTDRVKLSWPA